MSTGPDPLGPDPRDPAQFHRPGLTVLLGLAVAMHLVIFAVYSRSGTPEPLTLVLSGMGVVLGFTATLLYGLRFISTELVCQLLLWFAVAWNALAMVTGLLNSGELEPSIYLSHLALVVMVFTLLPLPRAAAFSSGSIVLLFALAVTRARVDWVLLSATAFTGVLISYMTLFGQRLGVAPTGDLPLSLGTQALDPVTGLLTRQAALERLRVIRNMRDFRLWQGSIMLLEAELQDQPQHGPAAQSEVLRGLSRQVAQGLREPDFACRWEGQVLMVVWHDAALAQRPAARLSLPFREVMLPTTIHVGTALFHESPDLQGVVALAEVRLEEARRTAESRRV